eukprot:Phypoly_transcript_01075.p1 GENE.Phypoly_transcript_01075~~Phypoly_transcript_01075.p1  ORF type:complete len:1059 (+),score=134.10 Phypoly_transcript_01075:98-3274(+)
MVSVLQRSGPTGGIVQHQGILESALRDLFSGEDIEKNVRKAFNVRSPHSGSLLECDVWIQRLHLCFEFQDPHHYGTTWDANIPLEVIKNADSLKRNLARSMGETMIEVPCWWDGNVQSLASTIIFARPDLQLDVTAPIPLNQPENFFLSIMPEIGELMLASFPPVEFKNQISSENSWWLGEKYDGIRAYWNPRIKQMYSRNSVLLRFPSSFQGAFGKIYLDGELWFGRGRFSDSQKLAFYSHSSPTNWSLLRFIVFDVPYAIKPLPFEARYAKLLKNLRSIFVCNAFRVLCAHGLQLAQILKDVLDGGGEGVIMRKPKSFYEHGRSANLVKLKAARGDKEALVVKYTPATSSYVLQMPDGNNFSLKVDEKPYHPQEYKKGDVVTFSYENFSRNSIPVNPKILRVRKDLSWKGVLAQESRPSLLGEISGKRVGQHVPGDATQETRKQRLRKFYEDLATDLGMDPRAPNTWYTLSRSTVMEHKGGASALGHYGGSLVHSLIDLFPDLGLAKHMFTITTQKYWGSMSNRRRFFEKYASDQGFDPLVPDNWYTTRVDALEYKKGGATLKSMYNGSMISALLHVFPELPWDEAKFSNLRKGYWSDPKNIRKFFVQYAQDHGFDPLVAEKWYSVDRGDVLNTKLGRTFLGFYDNNIVAALMEVFPNIGLEESKFPVTYSDFWQDIGNRRTFFEKFAASNNFDHLNVKAWYELHPNELTTNKDAEKILKFYRGNFGVALRHLFPEIGVELAKVPKTLDYWKFDENKRKFFEKFAKRRKFDPLVAANWYNIMTKDIEDAKGQGLIKDSTFIDTLCQVFPEVKFDKLQFKVLPFKFLSDPKNRRAVLESYARQHGFEPLTPSNWYEVRLKAFARSAKSGSALLSYYGYNLATALRDLLPEVKFDFAKFHAPPKDYWHDVDNRRMFYINNVAKRLGFDPLVPTNWYSVSYEQLRDKRIKLPGWYGGDLAQALLNLFPELNLERAKLYHLRPREYFASRENQRNFLIDFANNQSFDPLLAQNWYSVTKRKLLVSESGGRFVLHAHSNSLRETLTALFPDIGLEKYKMPP